MDKKVFVVLADGRVGYISDICTCDECFERGEAEFTVVDINGNYLDCLKYSQLFSADYVLNVAFSFEELSKFNGVSEIVCDLLHEKLLERS